MTTLERVRRGPSGATQPFTPSLMRQSLSKRRFASRLPQERPGLPGAPRGIGRLKALQTASEPHSLRQES